MPRLFVPRALPALIVIALLALAAAPRTRWLPGFLASKVATLDSGGVPVPAVTLPTPRVQASDPLVGNRIWPNDLGLDHTLVLEPDHDHFLVTDATTAPPWTLVPGRAARGRAPRDRAVGACARPLLPRECRRIREG